MNRIVKQNNKSQVYYQMNVRTFCDSNGDGYGDFKGATSKLDYIKELNIDIIWLMPCFPSPLVDDGYDVADFYNIHPHLGTLNDFKTFLRTAHEYGIKVLLDWIPNHCSDQHEWFLKAVEDPTSKYHNFFVWSKTGKEYELASIIFSDAENSNWEWCPKVGKYYWHRFYKEQPDLNYDNPELVLEMEKMIRYWLDMGVDGFRVDAVRGLFEREGTSCDNLPETHNYYKKMRSMIDENYPGTITMCEAVGDMEDTSAYLGNGDEFTHALNFPLTAAIFIALADGETNLLKMIFEKTFGVTPKGGDWVNFLRNHDALLLDPFSNLINMEKYMRYYVTSDQHLLHGHTTPKRLAPLINNDISKYCLINSLIFAAPGSPIIYNGDEIGMGDLPELKDRFGLRTPMQWNDSLNAGFSTSAKTYLPVISDEIYGYKKVNLQKQLNDPNSYFAKTKIIINAYHTTPALISNNFKVLESSEKGIFAFTRGTDDEIVYCLFNFASQSQPLPESIFNSVRSLTDTLNLCDSSHIKKEGRMPPYSTYWFTKKK